MEIYGAKKGCVGAGLVARCGRNADESTINSRFSFLFPFFFQVVVAIVRPACAAKNVLTLSKHSELALHINSHGKVTAENILRTYRKYISYTISYICTIYHQENKAYRSGNVLKQLLLTQLAFINYHWHLN